ncbi:MAG: AAA domain-containing protein [Planctomycetota bacterium]
MDESESKPRVLRAVKKELGYRRAGSQNKSLLSRVEELLSGTRGSAEKEQQKLWEDHPSAPESESPGVTTAHAAETKTPSTAREPSRARKEPEGRPAKLVDTYSLVMRPGSGFGRPAWVPPPQCTVHLGLTPETPRIERFIISLGKLIEEMKSKRSSKQRIELSHGMSVDLEVRESCYRFPFDGDEQIFEDAEVELQAGETRGYGRIVSLSGSHLVVGTSTDFGSHIKHALLFVDTTALLVALRQRLTEARDREYELNLALADRLVSGHSMTLDVACPAEVDDDLRPDQRSAVGKALRESVFYLWGPPGTGKTKTLSSVVASLFEDGRRVLICSNTNQAVDQVLLKLCDSLGKNHEALEQGHVLRVGNVVHEGLIERYGDYVTPDGIVKRRSVGLRARQESLRAELSKIDEEHQQLADAKEALEELARAAGAMKDCDAQLAEVAMATKRAEAERLRAQEQDTKAKLDLKKVRTAGPLKRLLLPTAANCEQRRASAQKAISRQEAGLRDLQHRASELESMVAASQAIRARCKERIGRHSEKTVRQLSESLTKQREAVRRELEDIARQIEKLEEELIPKARILGTTLTKTYLKVKQLGRFDTVIVDEVSMALLPALYVAGGLALERVIVSGDFRQLAPIVTTEEEELREELGRDVFETAGVVELCERRAEAAHVQMLREQFRMAPSICERISGPMYAGELVTAAGRRANPLPAPTPFVGALTVVDTSRLHPFESLSMGGSRTNLLHTLVTRNIALQLKQAGCLPSVDSMGVVTPYKAQAALHREVLNDAGLELVAAGTVHRYQGDEKSLIAVDFPESEGPARRIGMFLQGTRPSSISARLLNVAVSRAKEHLVVVANLTHLNKDLPDDALLRTMLCEMQAEGTVVDARDVLAFKPLKDEATRFGLGSDDFSDYIRAIHDEQSFEGPFRRDLANVRTSIVIYSAFFTPKRVASYADLFREKLAQGVSIRCVTRPPSRNGSMDADEGAATLKHLMELGVSVDARHNVHEKVAVVDQETVWVGSLNLLSFGGRSQEMMVRATGVALAREVLVGLSLTPGRAANDEGAWAAAQEVAACTACGGLLGYYAKAKHGPCFRCEGCGTFVSRQKLLGV